MPYFFATIYGIAMAMVCFLIFAKEDGTFLLQVQALAITAIYMFTMDILGAIVLASPYAMESILLFVGIPFLTGLVISVIIFAILRAKKRI